MVMPATRAGGAPAIEALIKQVIDGQFGGPTVCTLPEDKKVFSHHEAAFERALNHAFTNLFAVVESQLDRMKHCRVFSCVQYGKPSNKRHLTSDAVKKKEIFEEMEGKDREGWNLRQR
jgi:hypothetical protein